MKPIYSIDIYNTDYFEWLVFVYLPGASSVSDSFSFTCVSGFFIFLLS